MSPARNRPALPMPCRTRAAVAILALLAAAPSRAAAPAEERTGLVGFFSTPTSEPEVAVRLAVAPAFGSAAAKVPISDAVSLQFPMQLDLGWRFGPLTVGGYGSWALARGPTCASGASCSATAVRAGLQATWTFDPGGGVLGWVGAASGWERATFHVKRAATDDATSYSGLEILQVQGGVEWPLHRRLVLGPYLLLGFGRYSDVRVETRVQSASASIPDRALHTWLHLGVRARVPLGGPW